jgi:hypothetical protein
MHALGCQTATLQLSDMQRCSMHAAVLHIPATLQLCAMQRCSMPALVLHIRNPAAVRHAEMPHACAGLHIGNTAGEYHTLRLRSACAAAPLARSTRER